MRIENIPGVIYKKLEFYNDPRGYLIECWRSNWIEPDPEMMYLSWTRPGQKRGPHLHRQQTDIFIFPGPGLFDIFLWEEGKSETHIFFSFGASNPHLLIVPPGIVHAYQNISLNGSGHGLVINLPNKLYKGRDKQEEEDIVRFEDMPDNPYVF